MLTAYPMKDAARACLLYWANPPSDCRAPGVFGRATATWNSSRDARHHRLNKVPDDRQAMFGAAQFEWLKRSRARPRR
jgi:hypothetical protein